MIGFHNSGVDWNLITGFGSCVKSIQTTKLGAFKEQNLNANFSKEANYANNVQEFAPFAQMAYFALKGFDVLLHRAYT
jgi:hypothetical protein